MDPVTREEMYLNSIAGGGTAPEPPVTREEFFLKQIAGSLEPFIVTCTPTAQDLSGVMDKTVAEIDAAYKAGKKILFKVLTGANSYAEVYCSVVASNGSSTYPSYGGYTFDVIQDIFIYAFTAYTDDGDRTSYATAIYTLTPMT